MARSRDERALQSLVGPLWESVARVADGRNPDDEDRAVLASAQAALEGQLEMRRYVRAPKQASAPPRAQRGTDTFVDLIWIAAEQLVFNAAAHLTRSTQTVTVGRGLGPLFYDEGDEEVDERAVTAATALVGMPRDEGIGLLIGTMAKISAGQQDMARAYDPLFERVALLAESSSGNTLLQY